MAGLDVSAPSPSNVIAVAAVWPPLCAIAVILRFYTRRLQSASLLIDDWLTIPAAILTFGMGAALIYGVASKSLGYPTPSPPNPKDALTFDNFEIRTTKQIVWAIELIQIPALVCVKLSFMFFYRRIFCTGHEKVFSTITISMIVIIIAWGVSFFFAILFECNGHFSAWWKSINDLEMYCGSSLEIENAWAISDFITDIIVIALPMPIIWKLRMSRSRRLAVVGTFSLGALAVAASITRMIVFIRAIINLRVEYKTSGANNLTTTTGLYWSMMESGLGLLAACLPTMYSLFKGPFRSTATPKASKGRSTVGRHSEQGYSKPFSAAINRRNDSMGSDIMIISGAVGPATIESHAMNDMITSSDPASYPQNDRIWIKSTIMRTDMVRGADC